MAESAVTHPLPSVPPEVAKFAAERGVTAYLRGVVGMTQGIYPNREVAIRLEEDAEIADDWYIVLDVDVTGLEAEQLSATQWQWSSEVFDHCPSTHVHFFRLGWKVSP
jgi:hypothetical protein